MLLSARFHPLDHYILFSQIALKLNLQHLLLLLKSLMVVRLSLNCTLVIRVRKSDDGNCNQIPYKANNTLQILLPVFHSIFSTCESHMAQAEKENNLYSHSIRPSFPLLHQ